MQQLDELDHRLITELRDDSRRSVRQLAKSLNESPSTIYNRVKRLEAKEVIKKWTVSVDFGMLELDTIAFVFISLYQTDQTRSASDIANVLKGIPGVFEVYHLSGEFDIMVKLRAGSMRSIGDIVMKDIRPIREVDKTVTNACFETVLQECEVIELLDNGKFS